MPWSGRRATRRRRARPRRGASRTRRWRAAPRTASAPLEALTSTISPPSNVIARSRTIVPPSASGRVERTVPSARRAVGRREDLLGRQVRRRARCRRPCRCRRPTQRDSGSSPSVRSVPGPSKCSASRCELVELARSVRGSRAVCSRQAATGSASSSRTVAAIASHSRSTSGSPNICSAQPAFGNAAIVQFTRAPFWILQRRARPLDRSGAPDAMLVEVGEELGLGFAGDHRERVRRRARRRARRPARDVRSAPRRAASSIIARRTCWSV